MPAARLSVANRIPASASMQQRDADDAAEVAFLSTVARVAGDVETVLRSAMAGEAGGSALLQHHHPRKGRARRPRLGGRIGGAARPVRGEELPGNDLRVERVRTRRPVAHQLGRRGDLDCRLAAGATGIKPLTPPECPGAFARRPSPPRSHPFAQRPSRMWGYSGRAMAGPRSAGLGAGAAYR